MSVSQGLRDRTRQAVRWLRHTMEGADGLAGVVALVLVAAVGVWVFVEVGDEVAEGEAARFDAWVLGLLWHGETSPQEAEPIGPAWLVAAAVDITALGGAAVLVLVILLTAVFLALQRRYRAMVLVLVCTTVGQLLNSGLKAAFGRGRPEPYLHLVEVSSASFPSGHAMMSAVVYLTLGALLAGMQTAQRVRVFVFSAAVLLTVLVGVTRVYLGVHHATDVLAGWAAGSAWASACWLVAEWLRRRGVLRRPPITA